MASRCFYELMSALLIPALVDDIQYLMYSYVFIYMYLQDQRQSHIKFDQVHIFVFYYLDDL